MKTILQWIILLGFVVFSFRFIDSCRTEEAVAQAKIPPVKRYDVKLLFEVDGCKVYTFLDGSTHYFTNCNGSVSRAYLEQNGKTTTVKYEKID